MKVLGFPFTASVFAIALLFVTVSCRKHKMDTSMNTKGMEKNINYPAAYVVNGESNTISVIKLSSNAVSDTIDLMSLGTGMSTGSGMGTGSRMGIFAHHIYYNASKDMYRLAVAVPGMDLSAGHTGSTAGMKGRILIVDAVKGTVNKELEVPVMNHNAVFSPDGTEIWTSQMDVNGKVLVLDAQTYAVKNTISVGAQPAEVTFSADGSKAYVANGGDNNVSVIDPAAKNIIATIAVGGNPVAAWIGQDGRMYVDNEDGQSVSVIDVATNTVVQTIPLGFMPGSVAHNALKKELWVTDPNNGKVHYWTWDTPTNMWVKAGSFDAGAGAHATAFTNDGNTAYVTNQMAQSVSIISTNSHSKITDITVGIKPNGIVIKH